MTESHHQHSATLRLAVVPDTQIMTKKHPELLAGIADWITARSDQLDAVLHVGDVVHDGSADVAQLQRGRAWVEQVAGTGLPVFVAPGNHDDDRMLGGPERSLSAFARHLLPSGLASRPWWGGAYGTSVTDRAGNYYGWVGRGEHRILVLVLEFGPRAGAVEWAKNILSQYPSADAIICTHVFLDGDGGRTRPGSPFHPRDYPANPDGYDGEDLWAALQDVPNLRVIVSGHQLPPCTSYRVDRAPDGHPVIATYQNWQHEPHGGGGRIRLLEWDRGRDNVRLSVVNTATGEMEHEPGHDVEIDLAAVPETVF